MLNFYVEFYVEIFHHKNKYITDNNIQLLYYEVNNIQ